MREGVCYKVDSTIASLKSPPNYRLDAVRKQKQKLGAAQLLDTKPKCVPRSSIKHLEPQATAFTFTASRQTALPPPSKRYLSVMETAWAD